MTNDLNGVKTEAGKRYHHGNLRESLIAAAQELLRQSGVAGFSLREAARRCGVSPAAPSHHFGDARGLLTAVAARGFENLADQLQREVENLPKSERLERLGAAYLRFAQEDPAIFSIMWASDLLDQDDAAYLSAGRRAFNLLERAVTGEEVPIATGPRVPQPATIAAWAMVHGLARLTLDGALTRLPAELHDEVLQLIPRAIGRG